MTNEHEYDQPATYQIRLKGVLDPSWSDWFGGLTITPVDDETMLEGVVPDQAALHGILAKINELGLSLISVTKISQVKEKK
jgi:hypothetical protein